MYVGVHVCVGGGLNGERIWFNSPVGILKSHLITVSSSPLNKTGLTESVQKPAREIVFVILRVYHFCGIFSHILVQWTLLSNCLSGYSLLKTELGDVFGLLDRVCARVFIYVCMCTGTCVCVYVYWLQPVKKMKIFLLP